MRGSIRDRPAIISFILLQRSGDADKLDIQMIRIGAHSRISMSADIDERKVRRESRVAHGQRLLEIACSL